MLNCKRGVIREPFGSPGYECQFFIGQRASHMKGGHCTSIQKTPMLVTACNQIDRYWSIAGLGRFLAANNGTANGRVWMLLIASKRELFYWAAILFTFSLGTSAGDLVAESSGLGYGYSVLLFAAVIGLVFLAYSYLKMNSILAFWIAYILTHPLGASAGVLSQPVSEGGLGLGTTLTSAVFLLIILSLVVYLMLIKKQALIAV